MNNQKKSIEITGHLLCPLKLGRPAYIQETGGYRKTSKVVSVESTTQSAVQFETLNTNYCLYLDGGTQYEGV